ncbi:hypothetical protein ETI06_05900 [Macrococcoides goetzii]|nr:phage tail spike protein [Macrococcus goetzii]TDM50006.1 hypothetical protein ETI06_05900 [Macrococcus goetzii]
MYKVDIYQEDGSNRKTLLDLKNKISNVFSASLDKQEDNIDSLSLDVMHQFIKDNNYQIKPYKTLVEVRDTKKNKIIFKGRVLAPDSQMSESGAFSHNLVFEGAEAFLQDTVQKYSFEFDKMPVDNLRLVIDHHNSELPNESYKHFQIGTVNVEKNVIPDDGGYHEEEKYFKRWEDKTTYQTLHDDLKGKYGGTFIFEVTDGPTIIHWLKETGNIKSTVIEIAKNLKSIQYKVDPTEIITRLKPLGATSETANGDELRLTIADANNGSPYIDIPELIAVYGIQTGTVDFDAYTPITLKEQAQKWITEQYQKLAKISITLNALDLSLIGIDPDDFDLFNIHRVKCPPLKIDEDLKIVGISINLITPHDKSITIGEKQLTIAELQLQENIKVINNTVPAIIKEEAPKIIEEQVPGMIENKITATVPDLIDGGITDFKTNSLGQIIEDTIDSNKTEIKDAVVNGINSSTNVIKSQALVVDYAMIDKLMANSLLTNRLVSDDAYVTNLMAKQIVTDKIKTTDIDLNRATVRGYENAYEYLELKNNYLKSVGNYTSYYITGEAENVDGYTLIQDGQIQIKNNNYNRSLYINDKQITTSPTNLPNASGVLSFFEKDRFGKSSVSLYSSTGSVSLESYYSEVNILSQKDLSIRGGSGASLILSNGNISMWGGTGINLSSDTDIVLNPRNGSVKSDTFTGNMNAKTTNLFAMVDNSLMVTDRYGWNGGSPEYRDIRYRAANPSSHEKYKHDIVEWNANVLDVYRNELQLFSYKFNQTSEDDSLNGLINHGIVIRENSNEDKFPSEWRNGDGYNQNEVVFWNTKAIQELINKVDELEAQVNGTTTT